MKIIFLVLCLFGSLQAKVHAQVVPQGFLVMSVESVVIGTQIWMKNNLNTVNYTNGDPIDNISNFGTVTTGAYAIYNNTPSNAAVYGKLYNWYAVNDSRGVCPIGWRVPSHDDFVILTNFLATGGYTKTVIVNNQTIAGGKLKEIGTTHWTSPNTDATDSYEFSALPSGWKDGAAYAGIGNNAGYWTTTVYTDNTAAYRFSLYYNSATFGRVYSPKNFGFAVRCIKN